MRSESVAAKELSEYLRNHDVPRDVILETNRYIGTIIARAWYRGLKEGIEHEQDRQEMWHAG